jgi:hypothetical protein
MAAFVIEKDTRTNDDVRRRAAEDGELRVLCTGQKTDLTEKQLVNEALIKLDRIGRSGDESSQGDGHEFVYRCEWREETRDDAQGCPEVFVTMRVRPLFFVAFFFTSLIELVLGT